jgi:hypothetical protein
MDDLDRIEWLTGYLTTSESFTFNKLMNKMAKMWEFSLKMRSLGMPEEKAEEICQALKHLPNPTMEEAMKQLMEHGRSATEYFDELIKQGVEKQCRGQ